jgi:Zn-dependent M16 (insulinase) family peptidase
VLGQEDRLLGILRDILLTLRLDNQERFRQMVLEQKARQESALVPAGNSFVRSRLAAHFREAGWIGEQIGGISNLFFSRQLARAVDEDWPGVLAALEKIRSTLLTRGGALANVTVDAKGWEKLAPELEAFLAELPNGAPARVAWSTDPLPAFEGLTLPAAVNYVGKGANLYDLGYTYDGSAEVVTRSLARTWIWDRVRVKGGAYGGSCGLDRRSGLFAYTSYRDPNLLETLAVYDEAPRFLRDLALDRDELTKAIIGTISDIDAYRLPDAKGWVSLDRFLTGVTDEDRQRLREQVLDTTAADFRAFGDVLASVADRGQVVILGGEAAIEKANRERGGWLTVTNVGV